MFLDRRTQQALVRIDAALTRSDPGLAGRFQRFNDWVAYERRAARRGRARTVLVVVLMTAVAALLIAGAMAESGRLGGSNGPSLAAAEILSSFQHFAVRQPSTRHGWLISCHDIRICHDC